MKGSFFVKRLNPSGFHVSVPDTDRIFSSKENPEGNFIMMVVPFYGEKGPFLYYRKTKGGYIVTGEGYIIDGSKEEMENSLRRHRAEYRKEKIKNVCFVMEVENEQT